MPNKDNLQVFEESKTTGMMLAPTESNTMWAVIDYATYKTSKIVYVYFCYLAFLTTWSISNFRHSLCPRAGCVYIRQFTTAHIKAVCHLVIGSKYLLTQVASFAGLCIKAEVLKIFKVASYIMNVCQRRLS